MNTQGEQTPRSTITTVSVKSQPTEPTSYPGSEDLPEGDKGSLPQSEVRLDVTTLLPGNLPVGAGSLPQSGVAPEEIIVEYDITLPGAEDYILEYDIDLSDDINNSLDMVNQEIATLALPYSYLPPLYHGENDQQYQGNKMNMDTSGTLPEKLKGMEVIVEYDTTLPEENYPGNLDSLDTVRPEQFLHLPPPPPSKFYQPPSAEYSRP